MKKGMNSSSGTGGKCSGTSSVNRPGTLLAALFTCWCLSVTAVVAEESAAGFSARGDVAYNRGDIMDAIQWYRKAADLGDTHAQVRLGYIYDKAEENEQAVIWYRKAAEEGDPAGQHGLAQMYATGEGVPRDTALALSMMKEAAQQDYVPSLLALAVTFEKGGDGVAADFPVSLEYWRKAAELGDLQAMSRIARAYRNGELGLQVDENEAARWQTKLETTRSGAK